MNTVLYPAKERGHVNLGWLDSFHSFSFGQYYDPKKVHFGALRVLNDDSVAGGGGFGTHPHDNMEIVSIPLEGALSHKDSTGNEGTIRKGDVQIMSAGTGLRHSEYNSSATEKARFLQIWVIPKLKNIKPAYGQKTYDLKDRKNNWQVVVSPDHSEGALNINQDARFSLVDLDAGQTINYEMKWQNSGLFLFVIEGTVKTEGESLSRRDALGISETEKVKIEAVDNTQLLAIEIPV
ncbi:MAG: pirin family protein [Bacteroidota bacterium]|nr:pirin family protein [Bacteroidota bacterium]